jgi:hypothetical protein
MQTASVKCGVLNNVSHLTKGPDCPTMTIDSRPIHGNVLFFFQMHQQLRANKDEGAGSKMRDARVVHGVVLKREWCKDNLKQARRSYERNHELGLKSKRKTDIAENGL